MSLYRRLVGEKVGNSTRVLDIGCGHSAYLKDVYDQTPFTYGADLNAEALAKNQVIKNTVVADAEDLPFEDGFFDVVALAWVLEHLERPAKVLREINRVLRSGGCLVFLTPNAWNYNVWLTRALPNPSHPLVVRRFYGRAEHDTYPTYYRANSSRRLGRLLVGANFERETLILNGDPSYISFNRPTFELACLLERVIDVTSAKQARVHIIGVYRKAGARSD